MPFRLIGKSPRLMSCNAHIHEEWEIVLNLEGEGTTAIDDRPYPFGAGTVACIPPHTPHTKDSENGFVDMFILLPDFSSPTEVTVFEDDNGQIRTLMELIYSIYHRRESNYRTVTDCLAQALEQMLLDKTHTDTADARVAAIAELAVHHFTDPDFSMAQAVAESGYCADHLRRLFVRQYGMSPLDYLTHLRIRYAKRLLRESERMHYSISEIAWMAGFADVCYFSRIFKKRVGVSPRDYMNHP